jgi:two-component system chemotaxis response regulator CheY
MSAAKKLANQNERVYKVLVIDDSADSVEMMSRILSNNGCDITMAFDGEDSEVLLSKKEFDLVIVDWNMPNMNGLELVKKVRSEGAHLKTPIIMITTEGRKGEVITALKAGVNNYIVKPFNAEVLKEKLDGVLKK